MSRVAPRQAPAKTNWTALPLWLAAAVLAIFGLRFFFGNALHYLVDFSEASYQQYWPNRVFLLMHVLGGSIALLTGPFQIWSGLRRRVLKVHRGLGITYLSGVAVGSIGASYLAAVSPLRTFGIALAAMAFAWLTTTSMALLGIRTRHIDAHKEWMIRSYVVTYGFVCFRIIDGWNLFAVLGPERLATAAWICWTIPLLIAEVGLQWKRTSGART